MRNIIPILLIFFVGCSTSVSTIDITKRNQLVKKYDLFNNIPSLVLLDDFFIGNNDVASIAPNLPTKPGIRKYYSVLKEIEDLSDVDSILVEINDINVYENNKLGKSEWPYANTVYIFGKVPKDKIIEATKILKPSEVNYYNDLEKEYPIALTDSQKVICLWWD